METRGWESLDRAGGLANADALDESPALDSGSVRAIRSALNGSEVRAALISGLLRDGYFHAEGIGDGLAESDALGRCLTLLSLVTTPSRVFASFPFWKPVETVLEKDAWRAGGTGDIQLHIDFVNAEYPPSFSCFYCVRDDPAGGGSSRLSRSDAFKKLPKNVQADLALPAFVDGAVRDLMHVGTDLNPFAVLGDLRGKQLLRFTGKPSVRAPAPQIQALRQLAVELEEAATPVALSAGDFLIMDQRVVVHGRAPLGDDQESIPPESRRLLQQVFGN